MANHLDYFIHTNRTYRGTVYSSGRTGMNEREKFEKWVQNAYPNDLGLKIVMLNNDGYFEVWQAACSSRKPYGYGIVDKDGYTQIVVSIKRRDLEDEVRNLNSSTINHELKPYRVVELFYEDSES